MKCRQDSVQDDLRINVFRVKQINAPVEFSGYHDNDIIGLTFQIIHFFHGVILTDKRMLYEESQEFSNMS